jgi:hypothetical protein
MFMFPVPACYKCFIIPNETGIPVCKIIARRTPGIRNNSISDQTVRNRLRQSGLRSRRPLKCMELKRRHRIARLLIPPHTITPPPPNQRNVPYDHDNYTHSSVAKFQIKLGFIRKQNVLPSVSSPPKTYTPIVLPFIRTHHFNHVFQQDNARCHISRVAMNFLNDNHIRTLPWPSVSAL